MRKLITLLLDTCASARRCAEVEILLKSDEPRVRRWERRAEELSAERQLLDQGLAEAQESMKDLEGRRERARQLARVNAKLIEPNRDLESSLERANGQVPYLEGSASAWKARAEELSRDTHRLRQWIHHEKVLRLQAEIDRRVAVGKLSRLRARRWWRLGDALIRWRRDPHRLDVLIRELWHLATRRDPLPAMPDVTKLKADLDELRRTGGRGEKDADEVETARQQFEIGNYERCLELLESLPADLRTSSEVQLLSRDCFIRLGDVSRALTSVRLALADRDQPELRNQARILAGRLRETDTNWLPSIGFHSSVNSEVRPNAVLHILKESLPFFERGYTMRSHMTLMAQTLAGFDPSVVTSLGFPRDQGFEYFSNEEVIDGVVHYRLDLGPQYTTRQIPYDQILSDQATLTARLSRRVKPAIIQAGSGYRGYETALVGLAVAKHLSVPLIYEVRSFLEHTWTAEFERSEEGEYYKRRHEQETRCLLDADFVITIADAMRSEIVGRGVLGDKVAVVPNVVDVERFQPRSKPAALLKRLGLDNRLVLGYVSNLGAREGIDNLIRAVAILRNSGLDVAGLVVGDGPERRALERLVDELGLESHFILTGHVPNEHIEDHYALIDLFVVPRIDDRAARFVTPLKPLEAMAMEIPVVAADLPALRELVAPGNRGQVFIPGDPMSLAQVAADLLGSEEMRSRFSSAAKRWILAERTLESNAIRYQDILKRVLDGA